jgi:hypothetical protein
VLRSALTDAFGRKLVYGVPYGLRSTHLTRMRYGVKAAAHGLNEEGLECPGEGPSPVAEPPGDQRADPVGDFGRVRGPMDPSRCT